MLFFHENEGAFQFECKSYWDNGPVDTVVLKELELSFGTALLGSGMGSGINLAWQEYLCDRLCNS